MSGERSGVGRAAAPGAEAAGGCCAANDAPMMITPITATVRDRRSHRELFIDASLAGILVSCPSQELAIIRSGKARGARIPGVCKRRATQPAGMPRPENCQVLAGTGH